MDPATIALIVSAAASAIGGIASSVSENNAKKEEDRQYRQAREYLNSLYYRDPLSTAGNRSILKTMDQRMRDQNDALQNRAVAGGATMENQLAARQANNETLSRVFSNILQGEDARRASIDTQMAQLDARHSGNVQAGFLRDAQNWQAWGSAMGNAAQAYGNASLLDNIS